MAAPYASTVITGTLGVEDVVSGKQVRSVDKMLYELIDENHLAPMTALLGKLPKGRVATNPKVEWMMKDIRPHWDIITAVTTASGATVVWTPTAVSFFKVGDTIEFPTETVGATTTRVGVVTAVTTTVTASAVGFQSDGTTALVFPTIAVGQYAHILSDASDEYSTMPTVKVVQDVLAFNYVQFLRVPYVIGNIQGEADNFTGPERNERRIETMREIKMGMERALLFGERGYVAGTAGRKYFTRGLVQWIERSAGNNILDWSAGLTETQFDEYLIEGPMKYGSQTKYMFVSAGFLSKLTEFAKGKQQLIGSVNKMGLAVLDYVTPNGKLLKVSQHHMFEYDYEDAALIFDPMYARLRPYGSQGVFKLHENIQANDAAGVADEWRILAALQVDRVEPHGYIHV